MGGGRARAALAAGAIAAIALLGVGCGESRHPNHQRPQVSTRLSVTITDGTVIVQPTKVGMGPEKSQQIPQNQNVPQSRIKADDEPLTVTFVVANQTDHSTAVTVRGSGKEYESRQIPPRSPETFGTTLPAGSYTVSASGVSSAGGPARFAVGDYRTSSENDVLLP
ncbi:MAG TPA: hypothetical protein VFN82_06855 [Solirubrobacterales bacterium]|nr:hypothetical protein [Solirubrobacterales bacterium]